nr:hypothetical protein [Tanacetum cinerariifolium]
MIIETIDVDFDELTAMASKQFSSGHGPKFMTRRTISSGLVQNIPSLAPPIVISLEPAILTGLPSSTKIDQDAPSTCTSQTTQETPSLVISLGVEEAYHDIEVAHMDNNFSFDIPIPEPSSEESFSQGARVDVQPVHPNYFDMYSFVFETTRTLGAGERGGDGIGGWMVVVLRCVGEGGGGDEGGDDCSGVEMVTVEMAWFGMEDSGCGCGFAGCLAGCLAGK